jgi:hypothetical protein
MPRPKKIVAEIKAAPEQEVEVKEASHRGRPSQSITVPVNRQTMSILETCVTLGQATSIPAVAAKLLSRAAEDLKDSMAQQVSASFLAKEKSKEK